MLSSKLLPEMESEDAVKKELLLSGMQNIPIPMQIEKIKVLYSFLLLLPQRNIGCLFLFSRT